MNMQNKLHTIQFFSPPDDQFAASSRAATAENREFCETLEKDRTPAKVQTHNQERI